MTALPVASQRPPLTVILSDETWGVSVLHVSEIVERPELTPTPVVSSFVSGLIAHRGARLPVVDLRCTPSGPSRVIVVRLRPHSDESLPVGLLVDRSAPPAAAVPRGPGKTMPDALRGFADVKARICGLLRLARGGAGAELEAVSTAV